MRCSWSGCLAERLACASVVGHRCDAGHGAAVHVGSPRLSREVLSIPHAFRIFLSHRGLNIELRPPILAVRPGIGFSGRNHHGKNQAHRVHPGHVRTIRAAGRHPDSDRDGAATHRLGSEQRTDDALLAHRPADPYAGPGGAASRLRRGGAAQSGGATGAGLRRQFLGQEPAPHGAVCRHLPGRADCRIADTTIELDALHRPDPAERPVPARLLRADGQRRVLERADAARAHRLDAVRADGAI